MARSDRTRRLIGLCLDSLSEIECEDCDDETEQEYPKKRGGHPMSLLLREYSGVDSAVALEEGMEPDDIIRVRSSLFM